jgi:hypothetical protein
LLKKATTALLIILSVFISQAVETPSQVTSGQAATFDERLGDDDGAALAILVSANERGNIDVCD